jgi:hypothetical protein
VVGPSPGSGEAEAPPRSRSSLSSVVEVESEPRVGRGGDRRLRLGLSPSPGVGRGRVRRLPGPRPSPSPGVGEAELPMAPEAGLGCCQPHSVEWHSSRSGVGSAVLSSGRSVERRSDCGHFGSVDWRARVKIRCQAILALNASAVRSVGVAIWPRLLLGIDWVSGEPKVCPLLEGAVGRDVNPPRSVALARGWARARRDCVP